MLGENANVSSCLNQVKQVIWNIYMEGFVLDETLQN